MKRLIAVLFLAGLAFGQTSDPLPSFTLPTYVGLGAAFNANASQKVNAFATAIYPVVSQWGVYTSTTADIVPIQKLDAAGAAYYAFQTTIRQGVHKVVYAVGDKAAPKAAFLLGGDAGGAFSQASPSGVNVNLAASFTATIAYKITDRWYAIAPIRGLYTPQIGWTFVPQIGIMFKP